MCHTACLSPPRPPWPFSKVVCCCEAEHGVWLSTLKKRFKYYEFSWLLCGEFSDWGEMPSCPLILQLQSDLGWLCWCPPVTNVLKSWAINEIAMVICNQWKSVELYSIEFTSVSTTTLAAERTLVRSHQKPFSKMKITRNEFEKDSWNHSFPSLNVIKMACGVAYHTNLVLMRRCSLISSHSTAKIGMPYLNLSKSPRALYVKIWIWASLLRQM